METVDISILPDWQQKTSWGPIQAWYNRNVENTPDEMIYKRAMSDQFVFFRDAMTTGVLYDKVVTIEAVSEHTSKSVKLPVYKATLKDGTIIIARCNFHDWKVSVWAKKPLEFPINLLNDEGKTEWTFHYCEGFEGEWILDSYENNKQEFTLELHSDVGEHYMWTFLFLLNEQL